eukprot:1687358-Pleurochrysis_carterae.AAC.1
MKTNEDVPTNIVSRQTWVGRSSLDVNAFVNTYIDSRPMIRPYGQGESLGLLHQGDRIYFVTDNYDGWSSDWLVIRYRLTCDAVA